MSTLADLQQRNIRQMEAKDTETKEVPSVLTEVRKPASTEVSQSASTEASTSLLTEVRPSASEDGSTDARKPVRKAGRKPALGDGETLLDRVDATLASREPLVGGVKATVDMSPELSSRAKRYLADHRGQSTRQVLLALFDAFLSAKGY